MNAALYNELLKDVPDVIVPYVPEGQNHVYQKYVIRILNGKRDKVKENLTKHDIGCKPYFDPPVHLTSYYKNTYEEHPCLPVTEQMAKEVLCIPMFPRLTKDEIQEVVTRIKEVL